MTHLAFVGLCNRGGAQAAVPSMSSIGFRCRENGSDSGGFGNDWMLKDRARAGEVAVIIRASIPRGIGASRGANASGCARCSSTVLQRASDRRGGSLVVGWEGPVGASLANLSADKTLKSARGS